MCIRDRADTVCIVEAYAQRYLGCTLPAGKRLEIHGTPGNDLACYMAVSYTHLDVYKRQLQDRTYPRTDIKRTEGRRCACGKETEGVSR